MAKTTKKVVAEKGRSDESPEVSPVYFLSLEVENVLCFKDKQVLALTDKNGNPAQWTVILGDNGVGKTTLLRCLAGLEMIEEYDGEEKFICPLLFVIDDRVARWRSYEEWQNENAKIIANIACQKSLTETYAMASRASFLAANFSVDITYSCDVLEPSMFQGLICYGYGATRHLGDISMSESLKSKTSESLFSEKMPLINAEEWLLQNDYAYHTSKGNARKKLLNQINMIKQVLIRILPDVEEVRIAPANEDDLLPKPEFLTPYGWVSINELGLGYRSTIAWMLDLAVRLFRRYPNSPDPLAEPAIVLVDEIDLHLHPRWQRTIMDFLTDRFPNTQFIVTAHSPLVVQAAQNANIVLLRREGDRVVIDNNPEIIENWRVDQVLTSVFDLQTARPKEVEPLLLRREALLDKSKLSKKDQAQLDAITEQLGDLPTAESTQEIKAMNTIRRAANVPG
jgi:energy-coupling factor transporter ATP-binding protein EcfA2